MRAHARRVLAVLAVASACPLLAAGRPAAHPAPAAALRLAAPGGRTAGAGVLARAVRAAPAARSDTTCRLVRRPGTAEAVCHNPDPTVTRVRLHVVCVRWWDPATDTAPAAVGPAQWVTLTGRCWKEVRAAWITTRPAGS